jgi:hypothetical protein
MKAWFIDRWIGRLSRSESVLVFRSILLRVFALALGVVGLSLGLGLPKVVKGGILGLIALIFFKAALLMRREHDLFCDRTGLSIPQRRAYQFRLPTSLALFDLWLSRMEARYSVPILSPDLSRPVRDARDARSGVRRP